MEYTQEEVFKIQIANIFNMLAYRGISVPDIPSKHVQFVTYNVNYKSKKSITVYFNLIKFTAIGNNNGIIKFCDEHKDSHIILINLSSNNAIKAKMSSNYSIELFNSDYFMIDRSTHIMVAPHRIMSQDEKLQILNDYNCIESNVSEIEYKDPMRMYINAKIGDMIEIIRVSHNNGHSKFYRIVNSVIKSKAKTVTKPKTKPA